MKIRLMTFHTPKNYGAVLQAYSLMCYLKNFSNDVKVIDFNTPELRNKYPLKSKPKNLKDIIKYILTMHAYGCKKRKYEKFENFIDEFFELTDRYESYEALCSNPPRANVFVTGSDQVFNPSRISKERQAFYLDFVDDSATRISYAASFGISEIPSDKEKEVASYLNKFNRISVREDSGKQIVEKLTNKSAIDVLDPVFLNNKDFWNEISKPYPVSKKKYLLYYRLLGSYQSDLFAKRIAKEKGLKLITVNGLYTITPLGKILWDVGPRELLGLYSNADFVVTDSFHGVAFSIIFEKQFVFTDMHSVTKERGYSLLEKCGIQKQAYIKGFENKETIDYNNVKNLLDIKIKESQDFLKASLQEGLSYEKKH